MPRSFKYVFKVTDKGRGGQLDDQGCAVDAGPVQRGKATLKRLDTLRVTIQWNGGPDDAPARMTGHFVISPAPLAAPTQIPPSPFRDGANYRCYWTQIAEQSVAGGTATYNFPGLPIEDPGDDKYELTFIAEVTDPVSGTTTQWSVDPEFDTGN